MEKIQDIARRVMIHASEDANGKSTEAIATVQWRRVRNMVSPEVKIILAQAEINISFYIYKE